jgi:hypothetical protein
MKDQTVYVRLEFEARVLLPVVIPDDQIDDEGELLLHGKYREAAVAAVLNFLPQWGVIDVSSELGVNGPNSNDENGEAKVFIDASDSDITEVRCEE